MSLHFISCHFTLIPLFWLTLNNWAPFYLIDFHSFSASFCVGPDTDYDVAFHYNPRLKDKIVYCNDKQRDDWGYEETEDYVPFKKDTVFELRFDVTQDGYEVSVDNTMVQFFKHRIPFQMVSHLYLTGDIRVNRVQLFDPESDEN
ncbi:galectin-4 [Biomphalaria glabrata]|nr:galectin-4-like [Biomphalaria glabrata]